MRDLTINAEDLTKVYGTSAALTAQLLDNTTPLSGKNINFLINGVKYPRTTDSNGNASLNINLLAGSYPCIISFNGDSTYNSASKTVMVRVLSNDVRQNVNKNPKHYFEVNKLPLKVVMNEGFQTEMGTSVKETELLMDTNTLNAPTFFFNKGNHGIEFEISVVIKEEYYFNGYPVADSLNQWSKWMTPVSVVTDAMDIPNTKYIMSIKKKKQTDKSKSIWKLRFKEYYENSLSFENTYSDKTASLSSLDLILIKYQRIDQNSPKEAVLALQQKLMYKGCWNNRSYQRKPNGVWTDEMPSDIYGFQYKVFGDAISHRKNGVCDRDTIEALLGEGYEGDGWFKYRELV